MKENCLEFNKLQWPKKTTVHLLKSIFCVTANHKSAQCQYMCNLKTYSLSTVFVYYTLWKHSVFSDSINLLAWTLKTALWTVWFSNIQYRFLLVEIEGNRVAHNAIRISREAGNFLLSCTEPVYLTKQCRWYRQDDKSVRKCWSK